ncbi:GNAT family N-acetyltransferase [Thalassospira sp. HF15]|uniref:GNAT family N-acetyltransferase n=1 Tax=Thalassospira sp. HF15 TaxID=2722755 RepID=UPI001430052A|nr:GNAT family N-acetyltransferase [Thalassospira sp. HF15]NIY74354.1 GNAT family N-acetyltransferase [Thalassospira sp. HF15]
MTNITRLEKSHLDAIIKLHHEVIAKADPTLVASETDAFFKDHLADRGKMFGILENGCLLAYCVLGLPRPSDPNFGTDQGLADADLPFVAHIDGVAVKAEFRGHNWQQILTRHRMQEAIKAGRKLALTTVAPGNSASLINILACGLVVRQLKEKYGGQRFLMRADLTTAPISYPHADVKAWCRATDFETCHRHLAAGLIGATYRKAPGTKTVEIGWLPDHCI